MSRPRTQRQNTIARSRNKTRLCLIAFKTSQSLRIPLLSAMILKNSADEYSDCMVRLELKATIYAKHFEIFEIDDLECLRRFRFGKIELFSILEAMGWNGVTMTTERGEYKASGLEAFCLLLRRLSSPCTWRYLETEFYRSSTALCEIFYFTMELFHAQFNHLVSSFCSSFLQERASMYAMKIYESGAPLDSCVGFIDATNIFISRPKGNMQRATYTGHKPRHSLKFQAMSLADGLLLHVFGLMEGRRHDLIR